MKQTSFRFAKPKITQEQVKRATREAAPFGKVYSDRDCALCAGESDPQCPWCKGTGIIDLKQ